jgi:hypothetical protein
MRRYITYAGALPRSADFLGVQQGAMIGLGELMSATIGNNPVINGLSITPTAPASMQILSLPGSVTQIAPIESTPFGSLPQNTTETTIKMGILTTARQLGPLIPPATAGQSQVWLVQIQFLEADDPASLMVLPYYNAANPNLAYSGPNNAGISQYTVRDQTVAFNLKAGIPAASGTQTAPTADPGWLPLALVTLSFGQSTISSSNIVQHALAPRAPYRLPQLRPGFSTLVPFATAGSFPFVVPNGVTQIKATVTGGGGGGGGCTPSGANFVSAAGGAAGGTAIGVVTVTPGTTVTVTVGAGGAAGLAANGWGGNGGTSSFGAFMSATAGSGGTWFSGTASPGGAPGVGVGGQINLTGGHGQDGMGGTTANVVIGGNGGGSFWGGGIRAAAAIGSSDVAGAPGAGGGGNYGATGPGLLGRPGIVVLEY